MKVKSLGKKFIVYHSKIIKIGASVEELSLPSGSTYISIDILVNGNSILNSGESITLQNTNEFKILNKEYILYPEDFIEIKVYYREGTSWGNLDVQVITSNII